MRKLEKLRKKNRKQVEIILKKADEIVKDPSKYKNLRAPLNMWKRVHIDKHFVLTFSVDEPSAYYDEAREKAMADAKAKAEQLAGLAGITLGKPTYISEGAHMPPIYEGIYYEYGGMAPAPAPAPPPSISPGEVKVSLAVQVAYSILQ